MFNPALLIENHPNVSVEARGTNARGVMIACGGVVAAALALGMINPEIANKINAIGRHQTQ